MNGARLCCGQKGSDSLMDMPEPLSRTLILSQRALEGEQLTLGMLLGGQKPSQAERAKTCSVLTVFASGICCQQISMIQLGLDICTRKLPLELAQEETHAARTWGTSMGSQSCKTAIHKAKNSETSTILFSEH